MKRTLPTLCITAVLALIPAQSHAETIEITQAASNKTIQVNIVNIQAGMLEFKTATGAGPYKIKITDLTPESVNRLREYWANRDTSAPASTPAGAPASPSSTAALSPELIAKAKALNEVIGQPLFGDSGSLWQDTGATIAERLGWRQESLKKTSSSYRKYTKEDYLFLGTRPYCATLYGGIGDQPERLSLVYANKGDYGSTVGMGEDHFKKTHPEKELPTSLEEAIDLDAEIIAETLTSGLGEAETQYYGEKEDKRKVQRWNIGDHAFILSSLEEEYTHLLIVPKVDADAQGKVKFISDSQFKKIQIQNVVTEDNGDVWIDNIPMVDQGPKGYCAPATFERAMRYMNVPADMYLLATAATAPGGGTNTTKLAEDSKRIIRSKARRIKDLDLTEDFEIKEIRKFIDKGVPILWQMCSLSDYNKIANERTEERESVTDFAAWAETIKSDTSRGNLGIKDNHHICMVIGYNEATNEVAVSDSWGPRYELRWVHIDVARAVTSYGGFAIDF